MLGSEPLGVNVQLLISSTCELSVETSDLFGNDKTNPIHLPGKLPCSCCPFYIARYTHACDWDSGMVNKTLRHTTQQHRQHCLVSSHLAVPYPQRCG